MSWQCCPVFSFWKSCPGRPVLEVLSWLPCPGSSALAALSWEQGHGSTVLAALSWQPCHGSPVLSARIGKSCPGSHVLPVLEALFRQSCSDSPVLKVLFCLSGSVLAILPVSCCTSCSVCHVLPVPFVYLVWLSSLSFSGYPVLSFSRHIPVVILAVLFWQPVLVASSVCQSSGRPAFWLLCVKLGGVFVRVGCGVWRIGGHR